MLALLHGNGKYDINGGRDGYEEGCDACELENVVCAREWPVILCSEDEVEQEDGGEGESDTGEEGLYGERLDKRGAKFEDGVLGVGVVLGLGHGGLAEKEEEQTCVPVHHPCQLGTTNLGLGISHGGTRITMPSASFADHCTSTPPHRDQVRLCSTTDKFFITQCEPDPGGGRCARCPPHDTYPTYRQIVPCRSPSLRHSFFDMESPSTGARSRFQIRLQAVPSGSTGKGATS